MFEKMSESVDGDDAGEVEKGSRTVTPFGKVSESGDMKVAPASNALLTLED